MSVIITGNIDISHSPRIKNITKKDINMPGMQDIISVEFVFTTKYEPKLGEIAICGEVLYQGEDSKKILTMWKDKQIETRMAMDVFNVIYRKCITKAVQLSDDLRLPPPLTFPVIQTEEQAKKITDKTTSKKGA